MFILFLFSICLSFYFLYFHLSVLWLYFSLTFPPFHLSPFILFYFYCPCARPSVASRTSPWLPWFWDPLPSSHRQKSHKVKSTQKINSGFLPSLPATLVHTAHTWVRVLRNSRVEFVSVLQSIPRWQGYPAIPQQGLCEVAAGVGWQYFKPHVFFGPRLWGQTLPCFSPPPRGLHFMFGQQGVGGISWSTRKMKGPQQSLPGPHYISVSQLQALVPHPPQAPLPEVLGWACDGCAALRAPQISQSTALWILTNRRGVSLASWPPEDGFCI